MYSIIKIGKSDNYMRYHCIVHSIKVSYLAIVFPTFYTNIMLS